MRSEFTVHLIKRIFNVVPQVISSYLLLVNATSHIYGVCVMERKRIGLLKLLISGSPIKKCVCALTCPFIHLFSGWMCVGFTCARTHFMLMAQILISLPIAAFLSLSNQMH